MMDLLWYTKPVGGFTHSSLSLNYPADEAQRRDDGPTEWGLALGMDVPWETLEIPFWGKATPSSFFSLQGYGQAALDLNAFGTATGLSFPFDTPDTLEQSGWNITYGFHSYSEEGRGRIWTGINASYVGDVETWTLQPYLYLDSYFIESLYAELDFGFGALGQLLSSFKVLLSWLDILSIPRGDLMEEYYRPLQAEAYYAFQPIFFGSRYDLGANLYWYIERADLGNTKNYFEDIGYVPVQDQFLLLSIGRGWEVIRNEDWGEEFSGTPYFVLEYHDQLYWNLNLGVSWEEKMGAGFMAGYGIESILAVNLNFNYLSQLRLRQPRPGWTLELIASLGDWMSNL